MNEYPKRLSEGVFIFNEITEGNDRKLSFYPPLVIEWSVYEDYGKSTVIGMEPLEKTAYVDFDFGMTDKFSLAPAKNFLLCGYDGLSKESSDEEIIRKTLIFDLMHAFFHIPCDPNYTHYHWALYGNLRNRTTATENNEG